MVFAVRVLCLHMLHVRMYMCTHSAPNTHSHINALPQAEVHVQPCTCTCTFMPMERRAAMRMLLFYIRVRT